MTIPSSPTVSLSLQAGTYYDNDRFSPITGDKVDLQFREETDVDSYAGEEAIHFAEGSFQGLATTLKVTEMDNQVVKVQGTVGDQPVSGQVRHDSESSAYLLGSDPITVFEGDNFQFKVREDYEGDEVAHRIEGTYQGASISLHLEGLEEGETFLISGQAPPQALASVAALRPFLAVEEQ